jgi:DNA-binding XRE family transcriptional regulator
LQARRRNDISVNDLARVADVSPATIFNWEGGKGIPQAVLDIRPFIVVSTNGRQHALM